MDKFFSASTIALNTLWIKMYENKQSKLEENLEVRFKPC